jgi:hypothetical protein
MVKKYHSSYAVLNLIFTPTRTSNQVNNQAVGNPALTVLTPSATIRIYQVEFLYWSIH